MSSRSNIWAKVSTYKLAYEYIIAKERRECELKQRRSQEEEVKKKKNWFWILFEKILNHDSHLNNNTFKSFAHPCKVSNLFFVSFVISRLMRMSWTGSGAIVRPETIIILFFFYERVRCLSKKKWTKKKNSEEETKIELFSCFGGACLLENHLSSLYKKCRDQYRARWPPPPLSPPPYQHRCLDNNNNFDDATKKKRYWGNHHQF